MTVPATSSPPGSHLNALADALQGEIAQLKNARSSVVLSNGEFVGEFAGSYYYRFEVPEEIFYRRIEGATFTFGTQQPIDVPGNVISLDNQFLVVALPHDFGPSLPEARCSWNYAGELAPVLEALSTPAAASACGSVLFAPEAQDNRHAVSFDAQTLPTSAPDQVEAVKKILQNKVTILWGPIQSGKTAVLALTAANYVKAGKRVLYVAPSNDQVDIAVLKTAQICKELGLDTTQLVTRIDLPSLPNTDAIAGFSFEHQIESLKAEKLRAFQERVNLLKRYWSVKIRQLLHEDFYNRLEALRTRMHEAKKQYDQTTKELEQLRDTVARLQGASMIERLKKGMSKEDLAQAQKQYAERQQIQKRLLSMQQTLTGEITRLELTAPVSAEQMKEFRAAQKGIEELGGLDQVAKAVDEFGAVDEASLLQSKRLIATSTVTVFLHPALKGRQYDLVIVDDAHMIDLPTLTALASFAKEKLLLAGDPFQLGPESFSNNELAQQWLKRDIYLLLAKTESLPKLFEWSQQHAQWSIPLTSHFASTPKLSLFMGSVLFDDKINVFASPKAKGKIYFIDTTELKGRSRQYVGKKRILPVNDLQTKRTIECVKHALMEPGRFATDIGIIVPFAGPTLNTKLQVRLLGIRNAEIGTPQSFRGRKKKAIIFDTNMAGVDYTVRAIDDKKIGEAEIVRLFTTVFSCVEEDLYVLADMSHFRTVYKDRLFTKLLMLLQAEADQQQPVFAPSVRKFDDLEWEQRSKLFSLVQQQAPSAARASQPGQPQKVDHELELKMKMMAKQQAGKPVTTERNFEKEILTAVNRVLGYRTDLNLLSQYTGGDLLLRNSFAGEQALSRLPIDHCQNEKDFRSIMERWNLLIYEMSGGGKADNPFFMQKGSETRVRQEIRHLSMFYSSAAEAALEAGKQKIAAEVGRIFQELLGKPQPGNPAEWSTAYINFLSRLEAYLSWISEQLRK